MQRLFPKLKQFVSNESTKQRIIFICQAISIKDFYIIVNTGYLIEFQVSVANPTNKTEREKR